MEVEHTDRRTVRSGSFRETLVAATIAALLALGVTGELGGARNYRYEHPDWAGEWLGVTIASIERDELDCVWLRRLDDHDGGPINGYSRAVDRAVDAALGRNDCP